ncbi:MAG: hypothetical protein IPL59_00960 [Candidatus Competibacteraceae bacterium]|nr:hypothetical protein [Candidatus Competibacteraceae bacterium]
MNIRLPMRKKFTVLSRKAKAAVVKFVLGIGQQMEELAGHLERKQWH